MSREYPEEHEFVPGDLGHAMDGPGVDVGKHQRRTLAVFSMTDKVCIISAEKMRRIYESGLRLMNDEYFRYAFSREPLEVWEIFSLERSSNPVRTP